MQRMRESAGTDLRHEDLLAIAENHVSMWMEELGENHISKTKWNIQIPTLCKPITKYLSIWLSKYHQQLHLTY